MFFVCLFAFITGKVKTVLKDFVMYCLHALALDLVRGRCNSMLYLFLAVLPLAIILFFTTPMYAQTYKSNSFMWFIIGKKKKPLNVLIHEQYPIAAPQSRTFTQV